MVAITVVINAGRIPSSKVYMALVQDLSCARLPGSKGRVRTINSATSSRMSPPQGSNLETFLLGRAPVHPASTTELIVAELQSVPTNSRLALATYLLPNQACGDACHG